MRDEIVIVIVLTSADLASPYCRMQTFIIIIVRCMHEDARISPPSLELRACATWPLAPYDPCAHAPMRPPPAFPVPPPFSSRNPGAEERGGFLVSSQAEA